VWLIGLRRGLGKPSNRVDRLSGGRHTHPMFRHTRPTVLNLILSVVVVTVQISVLGAEKTAQKSAKPNLYDPSADGKEQIAAALKTAKADDKRVLLKFGANW